MKFIGTDDDASAARAVDWTAGAALVQFCTTTAGSVLAGATIAAGDSATDASNQACMAAFDYRIDESNPTVDAWHYTNNAQRSCYFCNGDGTDSRYKLTGFVLPATLLSTVTGIDAVGTDGAQSQIWS